jgi:hypothetical protein
LRSDIGVESGSVSRAGLLGFSAKFEELLPSPQPALPNVTVKRKKRYHNYAKKSSIFHWNFPS